MSDRIPEQVLAAPKEALAALPLPPTHPDSQVLTPRLELCLDTGVFNIMTEYQ